MGKLLEGFVQQCFTIASSTAIASTCSLPEEFPSNKGTIQNSIANQTKAMESVVMLCQAAGEIPSGNSFHG